MSSGNQSMNMDQWVVIDMMDQWVVIDTWCIVDVYDTVVDWSIDESL